MPRALIADRSVLIRDVRVAALRLHRDGGSISRKRSEGRARIERGRMRPLADLRGGTAAACLACLAAVVGSLAAAPGLDGLCGAVLAALMLAIALTDMRRYIIPDELSGAALLLALFRAFAAGPDAGADAMVLAVLRAAAGALPLWGLMLGYRWWRGRDGLGLGDVKLAGVAGAWLGIVTLFAALELAVLAALGAYLLTGALRRSPWRAAAALPFGSFLAPAIWIGWLAETMFELSS
jgi:leader peptidase (prepilin peptidase)/N-methyltransferase